MRFGSKFYYYYLLDFFITYLNTEKKGEKENLLVNGNVPW